MKKNKLRYCTLTIYALLIISTISVLLIAYNNIQSEFTNKFIMIYVFYIFFSLIYSAFITVFNAFKVKNIDIKRKLMTFIITFSMLVMLHYIFKSNKNLDFSIPFGLAFGISFFDVLFYKKEDW